MRALQGGMYQVTVSVIRQQGRGLCGCGHNGRAEGEKVLEGGPLREEICEVVAGVQSK